MASIKLDKSRPVLITHLAPCRCKRPIAPEIFRHRRIFVLGVQSTIKVRRDKSIGRVVSFVTTACARLQSCDIVRCQENMPTPQDQYDDAMFDFSTGDYDSAIATS
jgi:hypothetical protein